MRTILVVANETLGGGALLDAVRERASGDDVRFVLCVPQNQPRAGLVVYDDAVFDAAQARVDLALEFVRAEDIEAIGEVGDPDPYTATIDAVHEYRPDEIIISTYPETRSGWLRRDLVERVRQASGLPVEHVVADLDTEGLPFHVTLAVANRTASGDELLEALKDKVDAQDSRLGPPRPPVPRRRPAGGRRRAGQPPGAHPPEARPRPPAPGAACTPPG